MKKLLLTAGASALVLLTAGVAVAQAGPSRPDRNVDISRAQVIAKLDARFAKLDANADRNISQAEMKAAGAARRTARFARLDADGNGSVTQAEMEAAHQKRAEARGAHKAKRHGGRHHMRGMRGKVDANGDGLISKAEFEGRALQRFDRQDADHNGIVTVAERQQARAAMKAQRAK